jgi:hypothetical protein
LPIQTEVCPRSANSGLGFGYTYFSGTTDLTLEQVCNSIHSQGARVQSQSPLPLSEETAVLDLKGHQLWRNGVEVLLNTDTAAVSYAGGGAIGRAFFTGTSVATDQRFRGILPKSSSTTAPWTTRIGARWRDTSRPIGCLASDGRIRSHSALRDALAVPSSSAVRGAEQTYGSDLTPTLRLVRPLGRGGMGVLWVAEHRALETEVVVKFLNDELSRDPSAARRIAREAAVAARVGVRRASVAAVRLSALSAKAARGTATARAVPTRVGKYRRRRPGVPKSTVSPVPRSPPLPSVFQCSRMSSCARSRSNGRLPCDAPLFVVPNATQHALSTERLV